ncbi:MAG: alpha/beta hydrolase-fold protein, partial [Chloroflexota bacterium]
VYPSQIAGPERAYRIYLPPCYGGDGRVYPTLYMLHGSASTDSHWDDLGLDEAADTTIHAQISPPFLIVMPNGGDTANFTSGGPFSFEEVILSDLIPFVEQSYCAWAEPAGRGIGGLSRGGYWALEIAFRHPADFRSVGGHSAALLDQYAGPDLNPQYTALSNDLGGLRIYLDIGADDWLINPLQQLHEDMAAAGISHTWLLNPGRHEDAYWAEHAADYLAWYSQPWPPDRHAYPFCSPRP